MLPIIIALAACGAAAVIIAIAGRGRRKKPNNATVLAPSAAEAVDVPSQEQEREVPVPLPARSTEVSSVNVPSSGTDGASPLHNSARSVLIVDDQPMIRLMLKEVIESSGIQVLEAGTGQQALELCSKHAIDLLLLDMRMPGMDGIELLRRIRQWNGNPNASITCAFISALGDPELEREAQALDVTTFIAKPFDIFTVRDYVVQTISREQRRKAQ